MPEETEMTVGRLIELLSDYPKDFKIRFESWSEGIYMDVSLDIGVNTKDKVIFLEEIS